MRGYKRHKSRLRQIILILLGVEVLTILVGLAYIELRPRVVKAVTVEAGEQKLDVTRFLLNKEQAGSFLTDIQALNTSIPGIYQVQIQIGRKVHTSLLKVVDTVAPSVIVSDQWALLGETVDPRSFITEVHDVTSISVYFKKAPDTTRPGEQEITLVVEDSGKNCVEKSAKLTVLDVKSTVIREAGLPLNITIDDFMDNGDEYEAVLLTDLSTIDSKKPGDYPVELNVNGKMVTGTISIVDTTAPKATAATSTVWLGDTPQAKELVKNIEDASEVTVSYKETPNFTKAGELNLKLVLADSFGNQTELTVPVTVRKDTEAPVIQGASDKLVYIGDSVSYKKGITVSDNRDKNLTFTVDNSKVNLKKEGTYTVTYSAKDAAGNKATKKINVVVKRFSISMEEVNVLCDNVLVKITNSSMTNRDTAYAIYKWIKQNISYTGDSDKSDWIAEAYRGMTNKYGDCFTYFSVAQALLTRAGIDNMEVTRVGGKTRHYWNLINCGDGWYHFDSCPHKDHKETFMLTDEEAAEYTEIRGNNYYTFDKSLYPRTPEQ